MATFQEGAGMLFKNFDECIDDFIKFDDPNHWFEDPIPGHLYTIGVDIAKVEDFTVMCVMDRMTHRLVGFYRINNVTWEMMQLRLKQFSEKYNTAMIILDATGNAGDMFVESLANIGVTVDTEYKYTNRTKVMLIDKLGMMLQDKKIRFPRIPQLVNELRSFTYMVNEDSGKMKYGSSKKDDCVNALALACWDLNDQPLGDDGGGGMWRPKRRNMK
jgi:phage FluMu gp28-like protein